MHTYVHCSTIYNSKELKPTQMSIIDKEHIYTMEYYAAIKNNEFVSFIGAWMNLETIILSKLTQEEKTNTVCYHSQAGVEQLEHMDTGRGASHTEVCGGGTRGGTVRGRELGRDNIGRNARYR